MSFAMKKWTDLSNSQVLAKIFKRSFIIFLLGFLMYWYPFFKLDALNNIIPFPLSETRILGVLQRIALCYLFASLIVWYLKPRTTFIIGLGLLLVYWVLLLVFGDAGKELIEIGPLINDKAMEKVERLVEDAIGKGAKAITGGHKFKGGERFYEPTILTGVTKKWIVQLKKFLGL